MPRLYPNDPLVVRTISISPTLDTLHLVGGRTVLEPRETALNPNGDPTPIGSIIDTVHGGISERYTLVFNGDAPNMRMQPGDYLYANGLQHRLQDGAWGIMRILPGHRQRPAAAGRRADADHDVHDADAHGPGAASVRRSRQPLS